MKKNIIVYLAVCIVLISCMTPKPVHAEEFTLYAHSAVLMDADNGRVLYGKEENLQRPMASTTKIMTLILALEYGDLDSYVTISDYAAKMPDVSLGVKAGEQYLLSDLLYSMMLESHNDSACAVAEHLAGDVKRFANMMNHKARELGLCATYFITPNGLDAKDEQGMHSTTAKELALIMKYCVYDSPKKELFQKICQTKTMEISDKEKKRHFILQNKNALLFQINGVLAGKTGFTGDAGYCYVVAVERDGKHYIISLLACGWPNHKGYKWTDVKKLLKYADKHYQYYEADMEDTVLPVLNVEDGVKQWIKVYCEKSSAFLLSDEEQCKYRICLDNNTKAPVKKGQRVGCVIISVGDCVIQKMDICAAESVDKTDFAYYLQLVFRELFCNDTVSEADAYNKVS